MVLPLECRMAAGVRWWRVGKSGGECSFQGRARLVVKRSPDCFLKEWKLLVMFNQQSDIIRSENKTVL